MNAKSLDTIDCKDMCKSIEIPTKEELTALNKLREIKKRVREVKKELAFMATDSSFYEQKFRLDAELIQLKKEWEGWEKERDKAANDRMIALGHLDP